MGSGYIVAKMQPLDWENIGLQICNLSEKFDRLLKSNFYCLREQNDHLVYFKTRRRN
ncbi:unknown [[Mannheimia] succiniciproducens MBEL55E]|uniref:Uncharacterized protein n=1 Tax=Mannheimia succiniciproducens (strain KCTC 0769BP / MBEL55E) TaxID=221988 RepID=Q65S12_MANSM|nr:unknown [[Mannheimia] succiniciproducens MBEL55E]